MMDTVLRYVTQCSLVNLYQSFGGTFRVNLKGGRYPTLKTEADALSETSVTNREVIRRQLQERVH
jgi:hypothetical protein